MSSRKSFYFRERVTHDELNAAFDDLEAADRNLAADLGFVGVLANAVVAPHASVPNLTVDVSGPGIALDQLGRRLFFSSLQNVNVAVDDNGVSTAVATGKEKIVSVFLAFDRTLSDSRIDGNSQTVFFDADEAVKFSVIQGAEADVGLATPPLLRSDAILLADVTRRFGQPQIDATDISIDRRQDALVLVTSSGGVREIRRGQIRGAISDLLDFYNAHVMGREDRHDAGSIDHHGGSPWADGTTNPPANVSDQLDRVFSNLGGADGAAKIGAAASSGTPGTLGAGSVRSQLDALLAQLNGHLTRTNAHTASALSYAGGGTWREGTTNPAASVETQLDKIVADLAADAGAARIGAAATSGSPGSLVAGSVRSQLDALLTQINGHITNASGAHAASAISYAGGGAWKDGTTNPAGTVEGQIDKLITDLTADAGAARIGAGASGNLVAGTVRSQLDALDATAARIGVANTFSATQTVNGAAGDTSAVLATTAAPTSRKLLWEMAGGANAPKYRLYAELNSLEITVNARWNGTQWMKDLGATPASKLRLNPTDLQLSSNDATTTPFSDTWANSIDIQLAGHGTQTFDVGGNWTSGGSTESFVAYAGPSNNTAIADGAVFRKAFPAAPSSITFTPIVSRNLASNLSPSVNTPHGTSAQAETVNGATSAAFAARVLAS